MEITEFIENFAAQFDETDASEFAPETEFRTLDEWSSLSVMQLIAFFDEEFEKQIGDKDVRSCSTLQDLYNLANA